jgi:hypothetical protein
VAQADSLRLEFLHSTETNRGAAFQGSHARFRAGVSRGAYRCGFAMNFPIEEDHVRE